MEMQPGRKVGWIATVLVMALLIGALCLMTNVNRATAGEEQKAILQDAIYRALVTCYATEGCYPQSLQYLEENYGVSVDRERFVVFYECFASNVLPSVRVQSRGGANT